MTFDWSGFLHVASDLSGQTTDTAGDEAKLRTSISRAYYYAFHQARLYMRANGGTTPMYEGSHESVSKWFLNQPRREYRAVGDRLRRLKDSRRTADYEPAIGPNITAISRLTATAIYEATRIGEMIDLLPS